MTIFVFATISKIKNLVGGQINGDLGNSLPVEPLRRRGQEPAVAVPGAVGIHEAEGGGGVL